MGQCLRSRECVAHSCFPAHCSGRSGGWRDRLLTTSYHPSTLCYRGTAQIGRKGLEAEESPSPPSPTCLWTSLTVPASSLLAYISFKFFVALFLYQSSLPSPLRVAEFFEVLQSLFISMSEFLTDGSALVEQQSSYEMQWLEKHWVGKSTPRGDLMKWYCWVLWG